MTGMDSFALVDRSQACQVLNRPLARRVLLELKKDPCLTLCIRKGQEIRKLWSKTTMK